MASTLSPIDGINPQLGGQIRSVDGPGPGNVTVFIRILRREDLQADIGQAVDFEIVVTSEREEQGFKVTLHSPAAEMYVKQYCVVDGDYSNIRIPWMRMRQPIAVWFHALRRLLRKEFLDPWTPSILVHPEFRQYLEDDSGDFSPKRQRTAPVVQLFFGQSNNKGRRPYNEDVVVLTENIMVKRNKSVALFGVLDGHGGDQCAKYVEAELPLRLKQLLYDDYSVPQALFHACTEIDLEFLNTMRDSNAGSTANILVLDKSTLKVFCANVGDARAVLSRDGLALDLSYDRKATDPEEIARINEAGGFVVNNRVLGSLAVSRAFGDNSIKAPNRSVLLADPEVTVLDLTTAHRNEFIVCATDGLWDVMTSQEVVDFVREELKSAGLLEAVTSEAETEVPRVLRGIADSLCTTAISKGSMDNVSAVIALIQKGDSALESGRILEGLLKKSHSSSSPTSSRHKTLAAGGAGERQVKSLVAFDVFGGTRDLISRETSHDSSSDFRNSHHFDDLFSSRGKFGQEATKFVSDKIASCPAVIPSREYSGSIGSKSHDVNADDVDEETMQFLKNDFNF